MAEVMNMEIKNDEIIDEVKDEKEVIDEKTSEEEKLPPANILVAGITGVGKSTLINAIFGEEMAKVGTGKPVTEKIDEYHDNNDLIHIFDTVGLELDSVKTEKSIEDITDVIRKKADEANKFDRIHAIWYCINSASNRYQGEELKFIKALHALGVPFIIVLTKCSGDEEEINAFQKKIEETNNENNMKDISIVQVMALPMKFRGGGEVEAFGLKELVNLTLERLPKYIKQGVVAAQRVDEKAKREECEVVINGFIKESKEAIASKLPIINAFYTEGKLKKMLKRMSRMYNTKIDDDNMDKLLKEFNLAGDKLFKAVIDIRQGVKGLINPFTTDFQCQLDNYFIELKEKKGFNPKLDEIPMTKDKVLLSPEENTIRMMVYFGYVFLQAIEKVWKELTEKQLKDIDMVADKLKGEINGQFRRIFNKSLEE